MTISVFIVDDHEIVRRGLAELFGTAPGLSVVGQAGSVLEARREVPRVWPDVAVIDVRLPDGDGVSLCRELRDHKPDLRAIMLASYSDDATMLAAIMAGPRASC